MSISTTNKSINFLSDRGNDAYFQREVITIRLDAGSAPLVNTQDSYLTFSLSMNRPGSENGAFLVPDSAISGCPWESISLFDGNQQTLLEQMDAVSLWNAMKNYYGNNVNDEHLQHIYEGRTKEFNPEYIGNGTGATLRRFPTNGATLDAVKQPSRGGGFGSQYYQLENTNYNTDPARKVQVIYRFPMSGLLSAMKSEVLPLVVLNGLTIKITLMEGAKFLRIQKVQHRLADSTQTVSLGYGNVDEDVGTQTLALQAGAANNLYTATKEVYSVHGYLNNLGVAVLTVIPPATAYTGLILKKTADGATGYEIDNINNCSIKVGSYVGVGINFSPAGSGGNNDRPAGVTTGPIYKVPNRVTSVETVGDRIYIKFAQDTSGTSGDQANRAAAWVSLNNPVVCDLSDLKSDYQVTDIQMVCNVIQAPPEYLTGMIQQASSGQLKIQYNSYRDERINITTGALSNEIFIPSDLQRCYCMLAVNEKLRAHSVLRSDFTPSRTNLFNYQWIFNGAMTPNIPVDLTRLAANRVSPLQIIELEKAIDESSITVKDIQNPGDFAVIGRRLGAYGQSVSLLDKTVKCRINYSPQQNDSLLWHFYIYHTKMITFDGNMRVVME